MLLGAKTEVGSARLLRLWPPRVLKLAGGNFNAQPKSLEVLLAEGSSGGPAVWGRNNPTAEPGNEDL